MANDLDFTLANWELIKKLGHGGQGVTKLVKSKIDTTYGVLKLLKRSGDKQARARMHREVANLRSLHSTNARVPKVFEDNTADFDRTGIELYFVMEHIPGKTLLEFVEGQRHLGIDSSLAICKCLLETIRVGIETGIHHRDLKPENIILRMDSVTDVVIVDYGLSFNAEDVNDLTKVDEPLDNRFLALPERRAKNGNKRDPRSDLTSVVGILYYCLTGEHPGDLYRDDGKLVHRGESRRITNWHSEGDWRGRVESLMDRGLNPDLQQRFQTAQELLQRLDFIVSGGSVGLSGKINVYERAQKVSTLLRKHDRPTQLAGYLTALKDIRNLVINVFNSVIVETSKLGFVGGLSLHDESPASREEWPESLPFCVRVPVMYHTQNRVQWIIQYGVRVQFDEVAIMRKAWLEDLRRSSPAQHEYETPWQAAIFYSGEGGVPATLGPDLKVDFEAAVFEGIDQIKRRLIPDVTED